MWKAILLLALLGLTLASEKPKCVVCLKVKTCAPELLQDTLIDPIFNFLVKHVQLKTYPREIKKQSTATEARYFFYWESKTYMSVVDQKTKKFKVMEVKQTSKVVNTQKKLGMRSSSEKAPVSTQSSEADILRFINNDIRSKHFPKENVKCIDYQKTQGGYYMIYQRPNGEKLGFDVTISKDTGNLIVNYKISNLNQKQTQSAGQSTSTSTSTKTVSSTSTSSTTQSGASSTSTQTTSTAGGQKTIGGFKQIQNPLKNKDVMNVVSFLIQNVNSAIKYAAIVKVEYQVVNGYNFKLVISFDSSSTAQYQITVYQSLNGKYSVKSIRMINVGKQPQFGAALTSSQIAELPFLKTLQNLLTQEDKNLQGKGAVLREVFMHFPYFRFIFQTPTLSKLDILVTYEIFGKKLTVVAKSALPNSPQRSSEPKPVPIVQPQPVPTVQPQPVPTVQPQPVPTVQPQPVPTKQVEPQVPQQICSKPQNLGGYQVIQNPRQSKEVRGVLSYLIKNVNSAVRYASILKAESQVVNGYNFRLTISLDRSSSAEYVIIVYQSISGKYSVQSISLKKVSKTPKFGQQLTKEQLSRLTFLGTLKKKLVSSDQNLQCSETKLLRIFMNYPYFRFVFRTKSFSRLRIDVKYDVFSKKMKVVAKSGVGNPVQQNVPSSPSPSNQQQSSTQQSSAQQSSSTQQSTQISSQNQQSTSSSSFSSSASSRGFEPISRQLAMQSFIKAYTRYLCAHHSGISLNDLVGIYWSSNNHNFLQYKFKLSNGRFKTYQGSIDYIKYKLRTSGTKKVNKQVAHCLIQRNGVCLRCAYGYYKNGGQCFQVPNECSEFDYSTNTCKACYQGFYLDWNNVCQEAYFLCKTSDKRGNCLSCYRDYRMTSNGRCVFNAKGCDYSPAQEKNALCAVFNGLTCKKCVPGCYLSPKGMCKVPDPNCEEFDNVKECCNVCMHGYYLPKGARRCKAQHGY